VQRVRLDRIDLAGRPAPRGKRRRDAEREATQARHRQGEQGGDRGLRRKALARSNPEHQQMKQVDAATHRGDDQAGDRSGHRGQHDQAGLAGADQGAQPPRDFETGRERRHQRLGAREGGNRWYLQSSERMCRPVRPLNCVPDDTC